VREPTPSFACARFARDAAETRNVRDPPPILVSPFFLRRYESVYFVISNPTPPPHSQDAYHSYDEDSAISATYPAALWGSCSHALVQARVLRSPFRPEPEALAGGGGKKAKKRWDPAVLGNFCRWRACMLEATAKVSPLSCESAAKLNIPPLTSNRQPAPKYLCTGHSHVKTFLDVRAAGTTGGPLPPTCADAARFLPRKPPAAKTDDLALIKFASSLLVELGNGKLAATIGTFVGRARAEASER
jgi:hypothetical protein